MWPFESIILVCSCPKSPKLHWNHGWNFFLKKKSKALEISQFTKIQRMKIKNKLSLKMMMIIFLALIVTRYMKPLAELHATSKLLTVFPLGWDIDCELFLGNMKSAAQNVYLFWINRLLFTRIVAILKLSGTGYSRHDSYTVVQFWKTPSEDFH